MYCCTVGQLLRAAHKKAEQLSFAPSSSSDNTAHRHGREPSNDKQQVKAHNNNNNSTR